MNRTIIIVGRGILGSSLEKYFERSPNSVVYVLGKSNLDLRWNFEDIKNILENIKKDSNNVALINTAAYTNVDKAEEEKDLAMEVNAFGAYKLANVCKVLDWKMIHISTDFVFNGFIREGSYTEYDKPDPINWYGYTKLMSEDMIKNLGCNHTIVRTGCLYNNTGGIIPSFMNIIKKNRLPKVSCDNLITPTSADWLAKQIDVMDSMNVTGTFHATCQGKVNPFDLMKYISRDLFNEEKNINETNLYTLNRRAQRPKRCVLDNFNLKALGIDTMPHWKKPIENILKNDAIKV